MKQGFEACNDNDNNNNDDDDVQIMTRLRLVSQSSRNLLVKPMEKASQANFLQVLVELCELLLL